MTKMIKDGLSSATASSCQTPHGLKVPDQLKWKCCVLQIVTGAGICKNLFFSSRQRKIQFNRWKLWYWGVIKDRNKKEIYHSNC